MVLMRRPFTLAMAANLVNGDKVTCDSDPDLCSDRQKCVVSRDGYKCVDVWPLEGGRCIQWAGVPPECDYRGGMGFKWCFNDKTGTYRKCASDDEVNAVIHPHAPDLCLAKNGLECSNNGECEKDEEKINRCKCSPGFAGAVCDEEVTEKGVRCIAKDGDRAVCGNHGGLKYIEEQSWCWTENSWGFCRLPKDQLKTFTVVTESLTAGALGNVVIRFTPSTKIEKDGGIVVTFPQGFGFREPEVVTDKTSETHSEWKMSSNGQALKPRLKLTNRGQAISVGEEVKVTISHIQNPEDADADTKFEYNAETFSPGSDTPTQKGRYVEAHPISPAGGLVEAMIRIHQQRKEDRNKVTKKTHKPLSDHEERRIEERLLAHADDVMHRRDAALDNVMHRDPEVAEVAEAAEVAKVAEDVVSLDTCQKESDLMDAFILESRFFSRDVCHALYAPANSASERSMRSAEARKKAAPVCDEYLNENKVLMARHAASTTSFAFMQLSKEPPSKYQTQETPIVGDIHKHEALKQLDDWLKTDKKSMATISFSMPQDGDCAHVFTLVKCGTQMLKMYQSWSTEEGGRASSAARDDSEIGYTARQNLEENPPAERDFYKKTGAFYKNFAAFIQLIVTQADYKTVTSQRLIKSLFGKVGADFGEKCIVAPRGADQYVKLGMVSADIDIDVMGTVARLIVDHSESDHLESEAAARETRAAAEAAALEPALAEALAERPPTGAVA